MRHMLNFMQKKRDDLAAPAHAKDAYLPARAPRRASLYHYADFCVPVTARHKVASLPLHTHSARHVDQRWLMDTDDASRLSASNRDFQYIAISVLKQTYASILFLWFKVMENGILPHCPFI